MEQNIRNWKDGSDDIAVVRCWYWGDETEMIRYIRPYAGLTGWIARDHDLEVSLFYKLRTSRSLSSLLTSFLSHPRGFKVTRRFSELMPTQVNINELGKHLSHNIKIVLFGAAYCGCCCEDNDNDITLIVDDTSMAYMRSSLDLTLDHYEEKLVLLSPKSFIPSDVWICRRLNEIFPLGHKSKWIRRDNVWTSSCGKTSFEMFTNLENDTCRRVWSRIN